MKKLLFCFIATLFLTNLLYAQKSNNKHLKHLTTEINSAAIDSFENLIKTDISNKMIAGGTYLLYKKGEIVATNVIGESDINTHTALKRNSIFRMASMTKPIASLAMLLLQEDGLINMNDRLDQYLPEFKDPVILDRTDTVNGVIILRTHLTKNPILLRNLLTHTSGFPDSFYPQQRALYEATFKDVSKYDLAHYSKELAKLPLDFEPSENWQYGPSINIAARVIEKVSGMSFNDFLKKRILEPMQMNDTKFYLDSADAPRLTTLYTLNEKREMVMIDPGTISSKLISGPKVYYSASGGINSTLDDYLKFCVMILKNGKHENTMIAKPETIALMKMDQTPSNLNASFGMPSGTPDEGFTFGYQIVRREGLGSPLTEKSLSWAGAYCTTFFIDPKREVIGIYLTQNDQFTQIPSWQNFYYWMMKAL
jgi:CubicO group peptidase (beta-lactamase class C family)